MRKMFHLVFPMLIAMTWLLSCCGRSQDERLTAADSLMRHAADSALTVLSRMDQQGFTYDADRAYHALLLTQARYRCYEPATSDSLIDVALNYYKLHKGDREKLTRAYIYKGAVMEELGHHDEAMRYFKEAQATVSPDDHFNQGDINLRLGNIYRNQIVADSSDITFFKEALRHFEQVPDSFYILTCLAEIGSSYNKNNPDSVMPYLSRADAMSRRLNDAGLLAINQIFIAEHKMYSHNVQDVDTAKQIALNLQSEKASLDADNLKEAQLIAALTLAKQNKPDSAQLYLSEAGGHLQSAADTIFYYRCCAEAARSRGDINRYHFYNEKAVYHADSCMQNDMQFKLKDIESRYDNEKLNNEKLRYRNLMTAAVLGSLLALCALAVVLLLISKRNARQRQRLMESEDIIERLRGDVANMQTRLDNQLGMNENLKATISRQIDTFAQLVEQHRKEFTKNPSKFDELFRKSYSVKQPDGSFWEGLRDYADSTFNGIVSRSVESCPSLTERDLNFLSLCCCELPPTVIMVCMGYNEIHSVYNKKRRLALALGRSDKLEEYIAEFKH